MNTIVKNKLKRRSFSPNTVYQQICMIYIYIYIEGCYYYDRKLTMYYVLFHGLLSHFIRFKVVFFLENEYIFNDGGMSMSYYIHHETSPGNNLTTA